MSSTSTHVRLVALCTVLLVPLLVHCSSNDVEAACRRMMDAVVERQPALACGADVYCATLAKLADRGSVRYRETELPTCLDEIHGAPECAIPSGWPLAILYRVAPACAATFGGGRSEGERCDAGIECGWTSACEGSPAVCKRVPGVGETCVHASEGKECQDGLFCYAPSTLVGDIGTCVSFPYECSSSSPTAASCTNETVGIDGACHPALCETYPDTSAHSGFTRCSDGHRDCGGGLSCDPGTTFSTVATGKCVLPSTFR